jgi:KipI family sensor histidine kinase inhibitor
MTRIEDASDRALLVTFAEAMDVSAGREVRALARGLTEEPLAGQVDVHPAYASVLVTYDPRRADPARIRQELARRVETSRAAAEPAPRTIVIPVRYDGPDLDDIARGTGLDPAEVVRRHAGATYEVAFLGFTPGFPYLTGLPGELATPRLPTPRRRVEAGSVAIAGAQAGIYPVASPGGWNVLGRTELVLFDPSRRPITLLAPGDRVRFVAVEVL